MNNYERNELARLRIENICLADKQPSIWIYNRWEWFIRSPLIRIVWVFALIIGWMLSWVRVLLCKPRYAAKYTAEVLDSQAKSLAKTTTDFEDTFHHDVLKSVVINSLLKSDMKDFVSVVPFARMLEKKLRFEKMLKDCYKPRPAAVFIIGLPRTGSTLLHQLCALDQRSRAIRAWEYRMPFECSDAPVSRIARISGVEKQLNFFYKLAPAIKHVHYVKSLDADECVQGFLDCALPDWYLWGAIDAPEAFNWYVNGDMTKQYENYKRFVRVVLDKNDDENSLLSTNLWLKSPHHTFKLPELARVFPEAKFVWLHRDPVRSVGSCCSMNEAILDVTCPYFVNPRMLGERTLKRLSHCAKKGMLDRLELEKQGRVFVDIRYEDLKNDLIGTMKQMYKGLGLDSQFPDTFEKSLHCYDNLTKSQAHAHRYQLSHFGLDKDRIEFEFQEYIEKYLNK